MHAKKRRDAASAAIIEAPLIHARIQKTRDD
jgi:hypothetical protein